MRPNTAALMAIAGQRTLCRAAESNSARPIRHGRNARGAAAAQVQQYREGSRIGDGETEYPVLNVVSEFCGAGERIQRRALYQTGYQERFDRQDRRGEKQTRQQTEPWLS
jgi:hypothetical protein